MWETLFARGDLENLSLWKKLEYRTSENKRSDSTEGRIIRELRGITKAVKSLFWNFCNGLTLKNHFYKLMLKLKKINNIYWQYLLVAVRFRRPHWSFRSWLGGIREAKTTVVRIGFRMWNRRRDCLRINIKRLRFDEFRHLVLEFQQRPDWLNSESANCGKKPRCTCHLLDRS